MDGSETSPNTNLEQHASENKDNEMLRFTIGPDPWPPAQEEELTEAHSFDPDMVPITIYLESDPGLPVAFYRASKLDFSRQAQRFEKAFRQQHEWGTKQEYPLYQLHAKAMVDVCSFRFFIEWRKQSHFGFKKDAEDEMPPRFWLSPHANRFGLLKDFYRFGTRIESIGWTTLVQDTLKEMIISNCPIRMAPLGLVLDVLDNLYEQMAKEIGPPLSSDIWLKHGIIDTLESSRPDIFHSQNPSILRKELLDELLVRAASRARGPKKGRPAKTRAAS